MKVLESLPESISWSDIIYAFRKAWTASLPIDIFMRAKEVMSSEEKAVGWLTEPNPAFGQRIPMEIKPTAEGKALILLILERIEHGNFS